MEILSPLTSRPFEMTARVCLKDGTSYMVPITSGLFCFMKFSGGLGEGGEGGEGGDLEMRENYVKNNQLINYWLFFSPGTSAKSIKRKVISLLMAAQKNLSYTEAQLAATRKRFYFPLLLSPLPQPPKLPSP